MEEIAHCKTCGTLQLSICHAFFECTWERLFWQELKSVTSFKVPILHPRSWASDIVDENLVARKEACIII
jgi:hypothetical protein